jgi:hypothetical protein
MMNFDPNELETVAEWCGFNADPESEQYILDVAAHWMLPGDDDERQKGFKYIAVGTYVFHCFYDIGLRPPAWIDRWYWENTRKVGDDTVIIEGGGLH